MTEEQRKQAELMAKLSEVLAESDASIDEGITALSATLLFVAKVSGAVLTSESATHILTLKAK